MTVLLVPKLAKLARSHGLVDHPNHRKHHEGAVPLAGGSAMLLAFLLVGIWYVPGESKFWFLMLAMTLVYLTGLLDDLRGLSVRIRFLIQAAAALVMALLADSRLEDLGDMVGLGVVTLGGLALPFTVLGVVGVANAFNLSDGLDGLAGGLALITAAFFAGAAYLTGLEFQLDLLLILIGVLAGFLVFNMRMPWRRRAVVFMGDSGSLTLGFLMAWFAVDLTQGPTRQLPPAAVLWFLAIPLLDTVSLMLRRLQKGRSPFHPGRDHLHHVLLHAGYSDCQAVWIILAMNALAGAVGFIGWRVGVPDYVLFLGFIGTFLVYMAGVRHAWKLLKLLRRFGIALPVWPCPPEE